MHQWTHCRTHRRGIRILLGAVPLLCAIWGVAWAVAGPPDAEVLAPGVAVRQAPDPAAPIVAQPSGGTQVEVFFTLWGAGGNWAQVALPSGSRGFVPVQALRRLTPLPQWRSVGSGSSPSGITRRVGEGVLEVPLTRAGGVFLVTAQVNDQVTTHFVVDTGAAVVTISQALADQLGVDYANKPKERVTAASGFMENPRIDLDSIFVPDDRRMGVAGVATHVVTLPGYPPEIAGLLGQSFLRHFHVTIDAERGVMRLQPMRP